MTKTVCERLRSGGAARRADPHGALERNRYAGVVSVEPFDHVPDGGGSAAFAIGYLRGLREALEAVSEDPTHRT